MKYQKGWVKISPLSAMYGAIILGFCICALLIFILYPIVSWLWPYIKQFIHTITA